VDLPGMLFPILVVLCEDGNPTKLDQMRVGQRDSSAGCCPAHGAQGETGAGEPLPSGKVCLRLGFQSARFV
jgi:hypothetical protein